MEVAPPAPGLAVEVALDGGLLLPVDGGLRAPSSGDHWLAVASRDPSGNRSPVSWVRLLVDNEAPDLDLVIEPVPVEPAGDTAGDTAGGAPWVPAGSVARVRAADQPAGIASLVLTAGDERREVSGPGVEVPLPAEGAVVVTVEAKDTVGNAKALRPLALRVDDRPPVGEIELDGATVERADKVIAAPSLVATLRVEDAGSGVASAVPRTDGVEVPAESWSGDWTPGTYTLDAVTEDRVGNRGELPKQVVEIDGAGPVLRWRVLSDGVEGPGGAVLYRPPVTLSVEAEDGAGVRTVQWATQGSTAWQTFAGSAGTVETSAAGLELRAEDGVGNVGRESPSWQIDAEAPRWVLRGPGGEVDAGGEVVLEQDQSVFLEAVDGAGLSQQEARLLGRRWRGTPLELRFPTRGRYWLGARAEDRLGNAAEVYWWVRVNRRGGEG